MSTWTSLFKEKVEYKITDIQPNEQYTISINPKQADAVEVWLGTDLVGNLYDYLTFISGEETSQLTLKPLGDALWGTVKLEKGNKPTDWTPAPEDMATKEGLAQANYTTINGDNIRTGLIKSLNGNSWINLNDGSFRFADGGFTYDSSSGAKLKGTLDADQVRIKNLRAENIFIGDAASVQDKINEFDAIDIGGRNLLRDSGAERTTTRAIIVDTYEDLAEYIGENVVVSFDLRIEMDGVLRGINCAYAYQENGVSIASGGLICTPSQLGVWKRFSVYTQVKDWGIVNPAYTTGAIAFYDSAGENNYSIRNIKIEKGNKATDWTPAPEDIDAEFAKIRTNIRTDEGGDLLISRTNSSTFMKLEPEKLSFIAQNNLTLASFGAKEMVITNAHVNQYLRIGSFVFVPGTSGDLTLKYIGQEE